MPAAHRSEDCVPGHLLDPLPPLLLCPAGQNLYPGLIMDGRWPLSTRSLLIVLCVEFMSSCVNIDNKLHQLIQLYKNQRIPQQTGTVTVLSFRAP